MRDRRLPTDEPSVFRSTIWTMIEHAVAGDEAAREDVYRQYRKPVARFIERRLPRSADVDALADDVMMKVLDPAFLRDVDRSKGRFRDLLLAVTRYRICNEGRKLQAEWRRRVSWDDVSSLPDATDEERQDFDAFYAKEVFRLACALFEKEAADRGSPEAEAVRLFYREGLSQAEIAERLGRPVAAVNTHLDRGRKRIGKALIEVLRPVCRSREEEREEAKHVLAILSRRKRP